MDLYIWKQRCIVRRESPKACSTRSTTVYQKPRSPFACHVYTTFLHTRNAFLKSLKKERKKRKKRIASFFRVLTFSLCRFLLSIDSYDSLLLQATIVVCCASSMCTCPSRNTYRRTRYNNNNTRVEETGGGNTKKLSRLRVGSFVYSTKSRDFTRCSLFDIILSSKLWDIEIPREKKEKFIRAIKR